MKVMRDSEQTTEKHERHPQHSLPTKFHPSTPHIKFSTHFIPPRNSPDHITHLIRDVCPPQSTGVILSQGDASIHISTRGECAIPFNPTGHLLSRSH
ncbi:hypothetical protein E2C01_085377 [Portunus trituberculatus]|uniref:Uncharacterized protein n=1 Tax=Portunus trituberculatus TaxID=210409 RepID=A0A5B7J7G1_PORTR|nr:hypothetical protein [Portunus trituberculatus]